MVDFIENFFQNLNNQTESPFIYEVTNVDGIVSFLKTIDWSERWLMALIGFHVTITFIILISRRCSNVQMVLFFSLLGLCYFSEKLNELGAKNWHHFAKEQYFDSNGLFISVVFSAPIILNCAIIVLMWLYESFALVVQIVKFKKRNMSKDKNKLNESNKDSQENGESKKKN